MNNINHIRAIAFDLDGTLTDSAPGLTLALDQALYALDLPKAGQQRVTHWIGNGASILVEKALDWALEQSPASADKMPRRQQQVLLRQLFDHYYQTSAISGSTLYPDVATTLAQLTATGLPLAIVTNKPSKFIAPLLEALNIARYFSLIIGGDDVVSKKPHPAPLFLVLGKFGLLPAQLLFVGDSRNDILAARAAGCPCIGMSYGYNYGENIANSNPSQTLDHFAGLLTSGLLHRHTKEIKP